MLVMLARDKILVILADGAPYSLARVTALANITKPYAFILLRDLVSKDVVIKVKRGTYRIMVPDKDAVADRLRADILVDLANIKDEIGLVEWKLTHAVAEVEKEKEA